jgi:hypothetical protein
VSVSSEHAPLVLARHLHFWLELVGRYEEPWRSRFFAALPAHAREQMDAAAPGAWLPIDLHVTLAEVLRATFGATRAHEYYRHAMPASLGGPLFAPLVRTGVRLFGLSPATFIRWTPKAWDASFRNAGGVTGEVLEPGRGRLIYRDLPAVCIASDAWIESSQGSAYGVIDMTGAKGVVRLDLSERANASYALEVEWTER